MRLRLSVTHCPYWLSTSPDTTRTAFISYCAHRRQRNGTRAHTQLKNTAPLSQSAFMRSRRARAHALHTCLAPRNIRPASHIATPQARTNGRAPPRSRRLEALPSAGNHHHHFCLTTMTTKHERRTSPRQCVHTILQSSPSRRMGLSALRKIFSDSCLKKSGLI